MIVPATQWRAAWEWKRERHEEPARRERKWTKAPKPPPATVVHLGANVWLT